MIHKLARLLLRASSRCPDNEEPIRTAKGEPLKDPINHASSSFKQELNKNRLYSSIAYFNNLISQNNEEIQNIVWLLADALFLASTFTVPRWVTSTLATEFAISTTYENKVALPNTSVCVNGYIDWVIEANGDIVLVDHKTSSKKPSGVEVLFHPQLNLYAYCYEVLYGRLPKYIGINHLRSGEIVLAEVDESIVKTQIGHLVELQQTIEKTEVFTRQSPLQYQSPCYKVSYLSNKIEEFCPFIQHCWPIYAQTQLQLLGET